MPPDARSLRTFRWWKLTVTGIEKPFARRIPGLFRQGRKLTISAHARSYLHTLLRANGNLALIECLALSITTGQTGCSRRLGILPTVTPTELICSPILMIREAFWCQVRLSSTAACRRGQGREQCGSGVDPSQGEHTHYLADSFYTT